MSVLLPSEFVCAHLAVRFIESAEEAPSACPESMLILCFLCEIIHQPLRPALSYKELSEQFTSTVGNVEVLNKIVCELSEFKTVDTFSSLVDSFKNVLMVKKSASFNGLRTPCLVTSDSTIGLFLRSVLARWDCLQFHEMCDLLASIKMFLSNTETGITKIVSYNHCDANQLLRFVQLPGDFIDIASNDSGDISSMERELHCQYDRMGPAAILTAAQESDSSAKAVATALHALMHSEEEVKFAALKHQHALLHLGSMWLHSGNATMAMAAIEEALKTAHHLGDHETVAHALLLLFEVFRSAHDPALVAAAEEILLRCAQRSAALNMQGLTARCTLLLAALRSRQRLLWNHPPLIDMLSPITANTNQRSVGTRDRSAASSCWRAGDVWAQASFALLGEIALSAQVITAKGILEDTEFTQSGPSLNPMLSHQQNAAAGKKENLQDAPLTVGEDLARLTAESSVYSADMWDRLGMLPMVAFELRRALAHGECLARMAPALVRICARLLEAHVDWARATTLSCDNSSSSSSSCGSVVLQEVLSFGKTVKRLLGACLRRDSFLAQRLDAALLAVLHQAALGAGDAARALRLAERLCQLTAPRWRHAGACEVGVESDRGRGLVSDEHFRARLLHCEAVARFSRPCAVQHIEALRAQCDGPGESFRQEECCKRMVELGIQ